MKYTIEFELPDNKTIKDELQGSYVAWSIWGYSGVAKAKPVLSAEPESIRCKNYKLCVEHYDTDGNTPSAESKWIPVGTVFRFSK